MKKTKQYIKIALLNGKVERRRIYIDDAGTKFVYNQRRYWELEQFIKVREAISISD